MYIHSLVANIPVQITRSIFFTRPPVTILDVHKSLLTISDQYHNLNFCEFFYKMAAGGHFGCPKLTFDGISGHFRSIRNFFVKTFLQNGRRRPFWMSVIQITFDRISGHFRSMRNFFF